MDIIFYDPRLEGHHIEHLEHIVKYTIQETEFNIHYVVHPDLEKKRPDLIDLARRNPEQLNFLSLTTKHSAFDTSSAITRSFLGWSLAKQKALEVGADHLVFTEMNAYQLVLGLPRARGMPFSISGILFFPYCRIEADTPSIFSPAKTFFEQSRKWLQLQWVLTNQSVENIFVLNDEWAAGKLNQTFSTSIFSSLPDPVPELQTNESKSLHSWVDEWWGNDRKHFLLFGSLREDKGVREAIEALRSLSPEHAANVSFHLLGAPREDLEPELPDLLSNLKKSQPNIRIHFEGRYLSEPELDRALRNSDVLLAPYQRTEGSSGVLGHAANYQLPVIGPKTGLVGHLIKRYNLGITINARSPDQLQKAITSFLRSGDDTWNKLGMEKYKKERSPSDFAQKIIKSLVN